MKRNDDNASSRTPRPRRSGSVSRAALGRREIRVLVVDDEPSICVAYGRAITAAGYRAITAQSGEAAMAVVRSERIDVLLVDLRIPDTRGDVLFEAAAAEQPHLRAATLFMTGDITERARQHIAACGCSYLQKPIDIDVMIEAIAALVPHVGEQAG
jgi:two-component system response regulator GlrR